MPTTPSYSRVARHRSDNIKNLGYDYEGQLFQNTLSKVITGDPKRKSMLDRLERILFLTIESVKLIKTNINWTFEKDSRKLN